MHIGDDIARVRCNFGERLRSLRVERGLSQRELGEIVSIDRTYILAVEKGRRNVSIDNIIKLSRGLDISVSELCYGIEYDSRDADGLRLPIE